MLINSRRRDTSVRCFTKPLPPANQSVPERRDPRLLQFAVLRAPVTRRLPSALGFASKLAFPAVLSFLPKHGKPLAHSLPLQSLSRRLGVSPAPPSRSAGHAPPAHRGHWAVPASPEGNNPENYRLLQIGNY